MFLTSHESQREKGSKQGKLLSPKSTQGAMACEHELSQCAPVHASGSDPTALLRTTACARQHGSEWSSWNTVNTALSAPAISWNTVIMVS